MAGLPPRIVLVTRETDYELLLARHATRDQARFFLETRGQDLRELEERHERFKNVLRDIRSSVPSDWRQAAPSRADLDRFLFGPDDIIVPVGQDGLVANVAKYLEGQPVIGINPMPDLYDGVLTQFAPEQFSAALAACVHGELVIQERTMAEAVLDNGDRLLALNELFVGHRSHQSARYSIAVGGRHEDQSSSGVIIASGTGATGWARSIMEATGSPIALSPEERAVAFLVREPFPSVATGTKLRAGKIDNERLTITSRMNDGGVIFADGIERDYLSFGWGQEVTVSPASRTLRLAAA